MIQSSHHLLIVPLHIHSPPSSLILFCSLQSDPLGAQLKPPPPLRNLLWLCTATSVNLGARHMLAPADLPSPIFLSPPGSQAHCKVMWASVKDTALRARPTDADLIPKFTPEACCVPLGKLPHFSELKHLRLKIEMIHPITVQN